GGNGGGAGIASTGGRGTSQLYSIALTPIEKNPDDRDVDTEAQAEAALEANAGAGRGGRGAGAAPANVQVKIVWDSIERRTLQLTRAGSVNAVIPSPDGHTYLFMAQGAAP